MIKLLRLFSILLLFSCKGESGKKEKTDSISANNQNAAIASSVNEKPVDCYDYLTELVRSSNFPFAEWKINKEKVNLIIDEENNEIISSKLVFDTKGTGTIGWVEYHKKDGKLYNTSAELESPVELKYNKKWQNLFDNCLSENKKSNPDKITQSNSENLKEFYDRCIQLTLPNSYDYDAIIEEKGFLPVDKKYYQIFPVEHQDNYKMAKLPTIDNIKPVILITYNESGQSTWYLFTLNDQYVPVSNIILYTSEELDNGTSKATTYKISKDYKITISQESGDKVINKKVYTISKDGKFVS
ncbi:hypothetical protein FY557_11800 [Chryseobacterium sp. SN22]|uniref:hypothetical protein n=1 Tax=Chryseobacterium sp. SN22 TaxID=2606431 RepID=UPI0011EDE0A1|nr:hypothetical protein [Chryseobacterium sp. SN22]KAA0127831.1 hypothetical protein FY557_11800 [Chryseobacterium sp. SN22]